MAFSFFISQAKKPGNSSIPLAPIMLPRQIVKRLGPNHKLMPDDKIKQIKQAVDRIRTRAIDAIKQQAVAKKIAVDSKEVEAEINKVQFRRYSKKELQAELKWETKIPYEVYFSQVDKKYKASGEVYGFIVKPAINEGSFGRIHHCHDMDEPEKVFIIKIPKDEAVSPEALIHGRKASLIIAGSAKEQLMKFAPGLPLDKFLNDLEIKRKTGKISSLFRIDYLRICRSMLSLVNLYAHALHLLHRDIKAENFHIDPLTLDMFLLDFDLAVACESSDMIYHDVASEGTQGYIAPECARKKIYSIQSDIYALGVTMIRMLDMSHPDNPKNLTKLSLQGIKVIDIVSDEFKNHNKIADVELRAYVVNFLKIMTHKDRESRPKTIRECEDFFNNIDRLRKAKKEFQILQCLAHGKEFTGEMNKVFNRILGYKKLIQEQLERHYACVKKQACEVVVGAKAAKVGLTPERIESKEGQVNIVTDVNTLTTSGGSTYISS
ncbi:MAG: protein kinase domain-containing protein [Gammaproteobacteria bacterium]